MSAAQSANVAATLVDVGPEDQLRAQLYRLLARFLSGPPSPATLEIGAALSGDHSELGRAIAAFAHICARSQAATVAEEYHELFIGLVRGELVPYGSYYLTGFLHEKPLAKLRQDMGRLGVERDHDVLEPEDHIASLCEMMAGFIDGSLGRALSLERAEGLLHRAHRLVGACPLPRHGSGQGVCALRDTRIGRPHLPRDRGGRVRDGLKLSSTGNPARRDRDVAIETGNIGTEARLMKQDKKEAVADRRSFLKLAGAGAAAGGAALVDRREDGRGRARPSPSRRSIARPSTSAATTSWRADAFEHVQPAARRGCSRREQTKGERHAQEEDERRRERPPSVVCPAGAGARHSGPARILAAFGSRHRRARGRVGGGRRQGARGARPRPPPRAAGSTSRSPSARTARSAARSWPRCRTASGSARSRASTARSTSARHCAKGAAVARARRTATAASSTR